MKIFVKNKDLRQEILLKIETYEANIKLGIKKSCEKMVDRLNIDRLKLGYVDRFLNFIGKGCVRKDPVTLKEVENCVSSNDLFCSDLYSTMNYRTYSDYDNNYGAWFVCCATIYPISWIINIKALKNILNMCDTNNQSFSEIDQYDYEMIYGVI